MFISINGSRYDGDTYIHQHVCAIPRSWLDRAILINSRWYDILSHYDLNSGTFIGSDEVHCTITIEYSISQYDMMPVNINENLSTHVHNISVDEYDDRCGLVDFLITKVSPQSLSHSPNSMQAFKESLAYV